MPQERAYHDDSHPHTKPGAFRGAVAAFLALPALPIDPCDHEGSKERAKKPSGMQRMIVAAGR